MQQFVKTTVEYEGTYTDVLVQVPERKLDHWGPDRKMSIVGKPTLRIDGLEKVTGRAKYTADIQLPRMVYGRFLLSSVPHAEITSIDTSRAEAVPGVRLIFTHKNFPEMVWWGNSRNKLSNVLDSTVRFAGEEIALVIADNEYIAEDALNLIEVEYDEMPFVPDLDTSLQDYAPTFHPEGKMRRGRPSVTKRGDLEAGFQEAEVIVESTYRTRIELHSCMEPHGSVVSWSGENLTVYESTQGVFSAAERLADLLKVPRHRVRVIQQYIGGGFGSKGGMRSKQAALAAIAAKQLGRPVKVILTRAHEQLATGNRPDSIQQIKMGATRDGRLTAMQLTSHGAGGAYTGSASLARPFNELYKCPNCVSSEATMFTNTGTAAAKRAPGNPQGAFALERHIDKMAEKCGLDPIEFRMKNYVTGRQTPQKTEPYTSKGLDKSYEIGKKLIGWERRNQVPGKGVRDGSKVRGIGMASAYWGGGGGPYAHAIVRIGGDGSVHLLCGTQDLGTGTRTVFAQVVAETLGIPLDLVRVTIGDTELTPPTPNSGGSRTVPSTGPAVRAAAEDAKAKFRQVCAFVLKVDDPDDLEFKDGKVFSKSNPEVHQGFVEIARQMPGGASYGQVMGNGFRGPNPSGKSINTFGAQFAEVEVDLETGAVDVLRLVAVHESGRILNPLTAGSQVEGGIIISLGAALTEERVVDAHTGKVCNPNFKDYKMMTIADIPAIETKLQELVDPECNHLGVKGIGEPPCVPTAAAVANAVYNATGVHVDETPMTPNRILAALKERA